VDAPSQPPIALLPSLQLSQILGRPTVHLLGLHHTRSNAASSRDAMLSLRLLPSAFAGPASDTISQVAEGHIARKPSVDLPKLEHGPFPCTSQSPKKQLLSKDLMSHPNRLSLNPLIGGDISQGLWRASEAGVAGSPAFRPDKPPTEPEPRPGPAQLHNLGCR
jgi:hypothetical protein